MSEEIVEVEIELPDDVILVLAMQAHELNITLNQHIVNFLMEVAKKAEDDQS